MDYARHFHKSVERRHSLVEVFAAILPFFTDHLNWNASGLGIVSNGVGGKCLACGKDFAWFTAAKRHYREQHSGRSQECSCHLCGKVFALTRRRNDHMLAVHGISARMMRENYIPN